VAKIQPIAVSNSSPLIYLTRIGRLSLVRDVYGKIWIPEAVFSETVTQGKRLQIIDASIIEKAVGDWIIKEEIKQEFALKYDFLDRNEKLGLGERDALKLCKQLNADIFIADDKEARRVAKLLKLKHIGTCGILIKAHKQGLISTREASDMLDDLIRIHFRMEPALYRRILKELAL